MLQNVKNFLNYEMHISKISSIVIPQCPQRMGSRTTPIPKPTDAQVPDIKWRRAVHGRPCTFSGPTQVWSLRYKCMIQKIGPL